MNREMLESSCIGCDDAWLPLCSCCYPSFPLHLSESFCTATKLWAVLCARVWYRACDYVAQWVKWQKNFLKKERGTMAYQPDISRSLLSHRDVLRPAQKESDYANDRSWLWAWLSPKPIPPQQPFATQCHSEWTHTPVNINNWSFLFPSLKSSYKTCLKNNSLSSGKSEFILLWCFTHYPTQFLTRTGTR